MTDPVIIAVLVIAFVVNLGVLLLAFAWSRRERNRSHETLTSDVRPIRSSGHVPLGAELRQTTGWTSEAPAEPARHQPPLETREADRRPDAPAAVTPPAPSDGASSAPAPTPVAPIADAGPDDEPTTADPLADPATGLELPAPWHRAVALEGARVARYGRAATVVLAELDGLERLVDRFGQEAADRLVPAVSDTFRRNTRAADRIARLGPGRFGALLTETDEVAAINCIERIRSATDLWLEAGAVALRLAIGWAEIDPTTSAEDALRIADERLNAERRTNRARRRPFVVDVPRGSWRPSAPAAGPHEEPAASS